MEGSRRNNKKAILSGVTLALLGFCLFSVWSAPSVDDPFNIGGRRLARNYYIYRFSEGNEPDCYYLWRKYDDLPGIPFSENVSLMVREGDDLLYVRIAGVWYRVDMASDEIRRLDAIPFGLHAAAERPAAVWSRL